MCLPVVEQHDSGQLEQRVMSGVGSNEGFLYRDIQRTQKKIKEGQRYSPLQNGYTVGERFKGSISISYLPSAAFGVEL